MHRTIHLALIVCLLAACSETTSNYQSFNVNDAPDAYRFQVEIPVNDFIDRILNSYTDPDLRKIIAASTESNPSPAGFFKDLSTQAHASDYKMTKHFSSANPEFFAGLESNDAVCAKMTEVYTAEINDNLQRLHNCLLADGISHNILINNDLQLIIELETSTSMNQVNHLISGNKATFIYFNDVLMLNQCIENLIYTDELSRNGDSLTSISKSLFSRLMLAVDPSDNLMLSDQISAGQALVTDTAYISTLLRSARDNMPKPMDFGWAELPANLNMHANGEKMMELFCMKPLDMDRCVNSSDIEDVFAFESSHNPGEWQVQITMTLEGTMKWSEQTRANIGNCIAIVINGEIVATPVVMDAMLDGTAVISSHYTREEAESLANQIQSHAFKYPMEIIQQGPVHP